MSMRSDDIYGRLSTCVESRIGLCIRNGDSESFRKTMLARMKTAKIHDLEEYLNLLEAGNSRSQLEWQRLAILLTTGESYFFRDNGHFSVLRNTILPELLQKRRDQRSLRVWSAGCASGEEPYSVAMLLDMVQGDWDGWDIYILGTDINQESLQKAELGLYSSWSFRLIDNNIRSKYFINHKGDWQIIDKIRKMVKFQCGNLLDPKFFPGNEEIFAMDIIICRNVFIYFNSGTISSIINNFTNVLNDGGYLITGHGELQGQDIRKFRHLLYPEAVIYQKAAGVEQDRPMVAPIPERAKTPAALPPRRRIPSQAAPALPPVRKTTPPDPIAEVETLIENGRYVEAVKKAEQYLPSCQDRHGMICLLASAYANSGDYDKAAVACREALDIDSDSARPYFLLAHIAEAQGNDEEAKGYYKKAVYLNPAFVAAYCELGGLYEKENDHFRAGKMRAAAIELLGSLPGSLRVKPYDITAGELLEYLEGLNGSV